MAVRFLSEYISHSSESTTRTLKQELLIILHVLCPSNIDQNLTVSVWEVDRRQTLVCSYFISVSGTEWLIRQASFNMCWNPTELRPSHHWQHEVMTPHSERLERFRLINRAEGTQWLLVTPSATPSKTLSLRLSPRNILRTQPFVIIEGLEQRYWPKQGALVLSDLHEILGEFKLWTPFELICSKKNVLGLWLLLEFGSTPGNCGKTSPSKFFKVFCEFWWGWTCLRGLKL